MTVTKEETQGYRDPSYYCSDALHSNTDVLSHNSTAIAVMRTDIIHKVNAPINKMTITNKKSRHHSNRQRSKACDPRRNPSPVHKKKNKHNKPGKHSPRLQHGRVSPKMQCSSNYRGNLWIRPVAVRVKPSPVLQKERKDEDGCFNHGVTSVSVNSPGRQVTESSFTYDYDDILMSTSPSFYFDSRKRHSSSPATTKTRINFGESGKPIKPRNALFGLGHRKFAFAI